MEQENDISEFERGLSKILESMKAQGASQLELDNISAKARTFYESRKIKDTVDTSGKPSDPVAGSSVVSITSQSLGATQAAPASSTIPSVSSTLSVPSLPEDNPPYPISFEDIAELIATGKPVPGIREIPDKINEEAPSEASLARRAGAGRKPWEV